MLKIFREWRVVSILLTIFALYWGWDAYQFVNTNHKDMSDFIVAFYISIVGIGGWVIKNWMTTSASEGKTDV